MPKILLVDDDDALRKMLRLMLTKMGHVVREARDGQAAVEMCGQEVPDLVLTDIVMPGQEGLETIFTLRHSNPSLKIIAMSGGGRISSGDYLQIAKSLGAKRVLAKPFSSEELSAAIGETLASL
jgi:CheY-like chemotaxis protein